jgi:hypothetical protein
MKGLPPAGEMSADWVSGDGQAVAADAGVAAIESCQNASPREPTPASAMRCHREADVTFTSIPPVTFNYISAVASGPGQSG